MLKRSPSEPVREPTRVGSMGKDLNEITEYEDERERCLS